MIKRYMIVVGDVVQWVGLADDAWATANPGAVEIAEDSPAGPRWTVSEKGPEPPAPPAPAAPKVTALQARLALLDAGQLEAVDAAMAKAGAAAQIQWQFSAVVDRDQLKLVQPDLGWSDDDLDAVLATAKRADDAKHKPATSNVDSSRLG